MALWWLSFCDEARPKGQAFLGVCIVEADGIAEAARTAWREGCNPGGQVAGWEMPADMGEDADKLARTPRNRLLGVTALTLLGWEPASLGDIQKAEGAA